MNANELADMLEDTESYFSQDIDDRDYGMICKASTVLRQQQAEIESLKEKVMKNTYLEEKVDLCKEKLKPVAELVLEQMAVGDASSLRIKWLMDGYPPVGTKLYTQSNAQLHPLTDEEICQCVGDCRLGEVCKKSCSKKPAIWIEKKALEYKFASGINTTTVNQENKTDLVPLYTHPVKELTDEEIMEVYMSIWNQPMEMKDIEKADITFARAILKKAQEK